MRRRVIVTFVGMLATVIAFAAPAFGAKDTDTAVEAGSTVSLTVEVDDAEAILIPAIQAIREAAPPLEGGASASAGNDRLVSATTHVEVEDITGSIAVDVFVTTSLPT